MGKDEDDGELTALLPPSESITSSLIPASPTTTHQDHHDGDDDMPQANPKVCSQFTTTIKYMDIVIVVGGRRGAQPPLTSPLL